MGLEVQDVYSCGLIVLYPYYTAFYEMHNPGIGQINQPGNPYVNKQNTGKCLYRWINAILQYLQCSSNGNTCSLALNHRYITK